MTVFIEASIVDLYVVFQHMPTKYSDELKCGCGDGGREWRYRESEYTVHWSIIHIFTTISTMTKMSHKIPPPPLSPNFKIEISEGTSFFLF